jgi:hypothetical protein
MCDSTPLSQIYNFFNRLIEGVQGLIVSMIYCFFNGEVTSLLKKTVLLLNFFNWLKRKKSTNNNNNFETIQTDLEENVGFLENPMVKIKRSFFRKSSTNSNLRANTSNIVPVNRRKTLNHFNFNKETSNNNINNFFKNETKI